MAEKREIEFRKHLLQILRFMLVVLCSHAALYYTVYHCYVYLVTQTSGPTAAWGLKLLFHLETQPKLSWAPQPTLGASQGPQAWVQGTGGISSGFPGWEWK